MSSSSSSSHTSRASSPAYNHDTSPSTSSQHLIIHLSSDDPTNTTFSTSAGQTLYQSRTAPHRVRSVLHDDQHHMSRPPIPSRSSTCSDETIEDIIGRAIAAPLVTRISRRYGRTARALREAARMLGDEEAAEEGLLITELEWLGRTESSRIRFGDGLAVNKQNAVDVRIDAFLKSTNGRGFSKMFATPDGRTYKWKTDTRFSMPAELVECDAGRRVSGSLVTFLPGCQDEDDDGKRPGTLRVSTRLLPVIDQIIVSWVIMERERRIISTSSADQPHTI
ncbi:hypothetical protein M408DRAFT_15688 [Serendipita vermifera MAFF 305830]|uniref:DUF6593 domain-containing protein n=1 Tax=Serendipita vermifera MAFF 305830 TaxID=933852 RepID=A0A0C2WV72_SERVB|nr:hypothetical protein M408DRAFT_15688 [Serendipita vermifera MAFF 305830]